MTSPRNSIILQLSIISLLCTAGVAEAKKPQPTIQGVGFLCTATVECQVSAIRSAVTVETETGPVILGVGASISSTDTVNWPITPVMYSSASPGQLHALPAVGTAMPNNTFLIASMITPDGLRIASRAQYDTGTDVGRTAVIVEVDPGTPAFAAPTFTNTLLDPTFSIFRSAASNISDDGSVAYGFGSAGNFLWTDQAGVSLLPEIDLGAGSTIGGANAGDGSRVALADYSCDEAFELCAQTGYVYNKNADAYTALLPLAGDDSVAPFAMTPDGQVVAGASYTSTLDDAVDYVQGQLVTWNAGTGSPTALGSPNMDWFIGNFGGITKDGMAIIVNFGDYDPIANTYISRPYLNNKHGSFKLEDVLGDAGVDLAGWTFAFDEIACANCDDAGGTSVYGVSPDGSLLFGAALHEVEGSSVPEGFIVSDLPRNYLKNYKPGNNAKKGN